MALVLHKLWRSPAPPTPRGSRPPLAPPGIEPSRRATVSVVVPCCDYGRFLPGCLASVVSQEGVDVRVLVIDDCSTDDSAVVGARLAERDDRIEFRAHRQNVGLIATVNEGLEWAGCDYVLVLSADDLLVPGALARAAAVMEAHPNVGMVYGRALQAPEGQPLPQPSGSWRATRIWSGAQWLRLRCRCGHNSIASPAVLIRGSVHEVAGGYDPDCHHTSDLNMWLRIAAHADVAHIRGLPQAIYRLHSSNMSRGLQSPLVDLDQRRRAFESFFASCSSRLDAPDRLRTMAGRALARQALWQASRAVDRGARGGLVDELVGFAVDVCPDAHRLREWRGLQLRRRIGAGRSLVFVPFIATGAAHRLRHRARMTRLRFLGT